MFSITVIGSEQLFGATQFEFYRANSQQYNTSKQFALLGNDPAILEGKPNNQFSSCEQTLGDSGNEKLKRRIRGQS